MSVIAVFFLKKIIKKVVNDYAPTTFFYSVSST
jgi:hypothetical protein